jgi:hypothetical protein
VVKHRRKKVSDGVIDVAISKSNGGFCVQEVVRYGREQVASNRLCEFNSVRGR